MNHTQIAQHKNTSCLQGAFFLISIPEQHNGLSADCQPPSFLPSSEEGRGSRARGVPDRPLSAANTAGARCQAASEQGLGMLSGLETASLGRRRRIQASQARRKVGKSAEMRVGSLQGASIRAIPTNSPAFLATTTTKKKNKPKKTQKPKAGVSNSSIKM